MKTLKLLARVGMFGAILGPSYLLDRCCHVFPYAPGCGCGYASAQPAPPAADPLS